nr:MAG: capsid protein [Cressdnaviricota sp.]
MSLTRYKPKKSMGHHLAKYAGHATSLIRHPGAQLAARGALTAGRYLHRKFSSNRSGLKTVDKKHHAVKIEEKAKESTFADNRVSDSLSLTHNNSVKLPKLQKTMAKFTYSQDHRGIIGGTIASGGVQTRTNICSFNTSSQIMTSTGAGFTDSQNNTALYQINPNLKITGSAVYTAGDTPVQDKFIIRSNHVNLKLCNFSTAACTIYVYVCKNRRKTGNGAETDWDYSNQQLAGDTHVSSVSYPVSGAPGNSVGYPSSAIVGNQPPKKSWFTNNWTIENVKKFELGGGAQAEYNINIKTNMKVNTGTMARYVAEGNIYYPGGVYTIFTVAYGQVVKDILAGELLPTTASVDIGYIARSTTVMQALAGQPTNNAPSSYVQNNIIQNAALGSQTLITPVDGVVNPTNM